MSWLYSQALVAEYLGENSLDGEQSAPLNGKPTQQAYCAPDKMMDFSRLSRFGMTFKPLMADRGEELLTLFREDFHARTSAPQEKAQALTENDQECGEKWRGSFVKYDPDTSLWRTHQCSLLEDLDEFLETWPQWGLMRNGECWEQRTLEQSIRGTESGLLPTPCARDGKGARSLEAQKKANRGATNSLPDYLRILQNWQYPPVAVVEYMMGWPLAWTDLKPLEMDKFHCVQQQHGES
jgi:hypothetical protein